MSPPVFAPQPGFLDIQSDIRISFARIGLRSQRQPRQSNHLPPSCSSRPRFFCSSCRCFNWRPPCLATRQPRPPGQQARQLLPPVPAVHRVHISRYCPTSIYNSPTAALRLIQQPSKAKTWPAAAATRMPVGFTGIAPVAIWL